MPTYRYRAIGPAGELQTGVMDAATEDEVVGRLRRQGCMPLRAEHAAGSLRAMGRWQSNLIGSRGLRRQQIAAMMRELATMLSAGQDLDRAFRYLYETAPSERVRTATSRLHDVVRDGSPLADAMALYPRAFTQLHVALVRAGEASGQLAPTLARLADLLERQQRLASSVTSALIYPCLLIIVAIGAIALLLTEVLPQFVPLFEQSGAALPASTQFLIAVGNLISQDSLYLALGFLALVVLGRTGLRLPRVRLVTDGLMLRLPVVAALQREILAARFARVLGTLLVNGVPLVAALGIVRDAVGNRVVVAAIDRAAASARAGDGLARPLAEAKVFPARTTSLLRLGEENAELGPVTLRAAEIHEERTRMTLERLVALLVPAITVTMGLAVAGIVTSLLTAMLSLNDLVTR